MLYHSYKHYTPDITGVGDYIFYREMFFHPFDYNSTQSPFVYRQISPFIAHIFFKLGFFYDTMISFSDVLIEKKIFFANLLSNYIALIITAITVSKVVDLEIGRITIIPPILAGLICFLCFGSQLVVMTMLVEGWTWAFIALGFYALRKQNITMFTLIVLLSIFQKETITLTLGFISFLLLVSNKYGTNKTEEIKVLLFMLLGSIFSFSIYIFIRSYLINVSGYESQLNIYLHINNLIGYEYTNLSWFFPNFLTQNVFFITCFVFAIYAFNNKEKSKSLQLNYLISILLAFFFLYFISISSGLKGDIAHVLFITTPIFSIYSAYYLYIMEELKNKL